MIDLKQKGLAQQDKAAGSNWGLQLTHQVFTGGLHAEEILPMESLGWQLLPGPLPPLPLPLAAGTSCRCLLAGRPDPSSPPPFLLMLVACCGGTPSTRPPPCCCSASTVDVFIGGCASSSVTPGACWVFLSLGRGRRAGGVGSGSDVK